MFVSWESIVCGRYYSAAEQSDEARDISESELQATQSRDKDGRIKTYFAWSKVVCYTRQEAIPSVRKRCVMLSQLSRQTHLPEISMTECHR